MERSAKGQGIKNVFNSLTNAAGPSKLVSSLQLYFQKLKISEHELNRARRPLKRTSKIQILWRDIYVIQICGKLYNNSTGPNCLTFHCS